MLCKLKYVRWVTVQQKCNKIVGNRYITEVYEELTKYYFMPVEYVSYLHIFTNIGWQISEYSNTIFGIKRVHGFEESATAEAFKALILAERAPFFATGLHPSPT